MLEAGHRYVLRIASVFQKDQDVRTHSLYQLGLPYGYADLISNTFTP